MKFCCILAILLTAEYAIAIATSSAEPSQCFFELVDVLKAKGIITDEDLSMPCQQCLVDPLKLSRLSDMQVKKSIPNIRGPVDMLVDGNSVLVAARRNKAILRFDESGTEIARYPLPSQPKFLLLHDNRLYVTTESSNRVMRSTDLREDGELTFTNFLRLNYQPNAIKFTPDGKEFLIGSYQCKIRVYDSETLELVSEIEAPMKDTRFIEFSADDNNIYVTHASNQISVYSEDYKFLHMLTFGTTKEKFEAIVFQCDGSKILVSQNGKLFFIDENDELIGTFVNSEINYVSLRDIAVTSIGTVFITDHHGNKLYIFE